MHFAPFYFRRNKERRAALFPRERIRPRLIPSAILLRRDYYVAVVVVAVVAAARDF